MGGLAAAGCVVLEVENDKKEDGTVEDEANERMEGEWEGRMNGKDGFASSEKDIEKKRLSKFLLARLHSRLVTGLRSKV